MAKLNNIEISFKTRRFSIVFIVLNINTALSCAKMNSIKNRLVTYIIRFSSFLRTLFVLGLSPFVKYP